MCPDSDARIEQMELKVGSGVQDSMRGFSERCRLRRFAIFLCSPSQRERNIHVDELRVGRHLVFK